MVNYSSFLTGMSQEDGSFQSVEIMGFHMSKGFCSACTPLKCFLYTDSLKMDIFAPISITRVTGVLNSITQTP